MIINSGVLEMDEIESIEFVGEKQTKDISISSNDRLFFCNNIYTHNSAISEDIITGEHVAESYKKVMTGDIVISISRKIEDKLANTARWHVIKNRYGIDGITFPSKVNTSVGTIEIYAPDSVNGAATRKNMANSNELVRKDLALKYEDFKREKIKNMDIKSGEFE